MVDVVETRQNELKTKKICRFCLSQNESTLSSIFSRDTGAKTAPLPLQVMACVSIEVFSDECMPGFVCNECRLMFDYCYRFKQMCKKADTCLRHYPLTGVWSSPMKKPKMNWNVAQSPVQKTTKIVVEKVGEEEETSDTILTMMTELQSYLQDEPEAKEEVENVTEPEDAKPKTPSPKPVKKATEKPNQKLLNKSVIRILNKEAQHQTNVEPRMTKPRLKRDEDGNLAIVTEILDPDMVTEPNPVESAAVIETNVFPCPHCERSFPLRQLLDIHMINHNRERSFNCADCEKSFFSKYDLQKHMLVHTGEKPFKCVVCGKGFTRSTLLHRHEKSHTDIPKYICVFCEKPFISQGEMEKHTERHRKNRPFNCKICNKSFAFKQGLERHEVVHCRFQPYQCQYCEQSFSTPSKLSRHLTAHAGARPYPCKLCPKSYLLSHHLTRHMRSHKNGASTYKCNDCDKTFGHRDDLIYHSAVHATQTLICPLCKDVLDDVEAVTEHVKLHAEGESYACEFCDLIFMTADRLQEHADSDHADEMVAYNEEEKANASKNEPNAKDAKSNDSTSREVDEVIEEFLYEEFSDGGQTKSSAVAIKEEIEWQVQSNFNNNSNDEEATNSVDGSTEYLNIIERSDSTDGPPAKVTKLNTSTKQATKKASPAPTLLRHKPAARPVQPSPSVHSRSSLPKENKKPIPKPAEESRIKKETQGSTPQPKTRQPTIQAALQGLPRSLSVKKVGGVSKTNQSEQKANQPKETETPKPASKAAPPATGTIVKQVSQPSVRPLRQRTEIKKTSEKPVLEPVKKSPSSGNAVIEGDKKIVEMMIGDKRVKVQKITMSKAQAVAMAREGRIQMKEGTMILKKNTNQTIKVVRKPN